VGFHCRPTTAQMRQSMPDSGLDGCTLRCRILVQLPLWFGAWGLGFGVLGLEFWVWGWGFGVWGLGVEVWGLSKDLESGVWGFGFEV